MADDLFTIQGTITADTSGLDQALKGAQSSVEQATSSISEGMDKATESTKQTTQAINDLAGGAGGGGGASGIRNLADEFDNLGGSINGAGRAVTALGGLLSGLSLGIIGIAKESLEAAGKFEQWDVAFTNLLHSGEAAKKMLSDLTDFALKTPFNIPGVIENAQKLMAFGFTAEQIIPMLRTLGDAAAGTGKGAEGLRSLTLAMGEMNERGVVSLRQLNMMAMQGVPAIELLANAYGVSTEAMTQAISKKLVPASEAIPVLLEGINEKFGGMMEKQSETFLGMLSNLQDAATKTFKAIGETMLPAAKDFEQFAFTALSKAQDLAEAFGKLPKPMQDVALAIGAIGAAAGPATLALGGFIWSIGQIVMGLEKLGPLLPAAFTLTGAMAAIARAAGIAGAAFGGWKLGEWLDTNLVKPSAEHLATLKALEDRLTALGIAFQQQKPSTDSAAAGYAAYLVATLQAAETTDKNAEATKNLNLHLKEHAERVHEVAQQIKMAMELMGVLPNPFAQLDKEADTLYRHFLDVGLGIKDFADSIASGVDFGRMLEEFTSLRDKMIEAGAEGSLGFVQVTDAIKMLGERLFETGALFNRTDQELSHLADETLKRLNEKFYELSIRTGDEQLKKPVDKFNEAMTKLGVTMDGLGNRGSNALKEFAVILSSNIADVSLLEEAWNRVELATRRMATDPQGLQKIIAMEKELYDKLVELGAPLGDQLALQAKIYQQEISLAERQGEDATAQIVALTNVQLAQQALYDRTHALGDLYRDLTKVFTDMWGKFSEGVATAIVDGKDWGDTFLEIGKQIEKEIIQDLVGYALKLLKDAIIENTNLLANMAGVFTNIFGGAASAAGGATNAGVAATGAAGSPLAGGVSAAIGGVTGIVGAVGAVGTMISSIIGNFQMARQETTLNAIELNTRQVSMFVGDSTGGLLTLSRLIVDNTHDLTAAFNGWFHDAFASLMDSISRIATTPASGGTLHPLAVAPTVNVNVMTKGGNARDVAREIVREIPTYLKSVSPKFSQ